MASFSLRARWVVPVGRPPIPGGVVTIAEGRIAAIGGHASAGPMADLGDVVLLPGLVNAHTHLEFSDLERPLGAGGMDLPAWIRLAIAHRKRSDRSAAVAVAAGIQESLAAGVTTLGEIATTAAGQYGQFGQAPTIVVFQEAIGFSAGRVDSAYADVEIRFNNTQAFAGLSPHAPYTVNPQLVEKIVALAVRRDAPLAMHLAESPEELQLLATGAGGFRDLLEEKSMWDRRTIPRGARPLDYLRMIDRGPRSLVIHGNYLAADEIEFIAARRERMSLVYCPRTHAYFRHQRYPLERMLDAGVRVVLGTDSRASSPDLDLLQELRAAAAAFPAIPPARLLEMATIDAADALGLADEVGSLAVGKRADLAAFPCRDGQQDPYDSIIGDVSRPSGVWVAGVPLAGGR